MFLASSKVMLVLLVQGPYFEWQGPEVCLHGHMIHLGQQERQTSETPASRGCKVLETENRYPSNKRKA